VLLDIWKLHHGNNKHVTKWGEAENYKNLAEASSDVYVTARQQCRVLL
jgi:hypothetical protein